MGATHRKLAWLGDKGELTFGGLRLTSCVPTFWVWVPFRNQTESLVALLGHPLRTKAILLVGFCGFGEDVGPNFPLDGWLTFPGYGLQSFWGSLSKHTVDRGEIRFAPFRAPRMIRFPCKYQQWFQPWFQSGANGFCPSAVSQVAHFWNPSPPPGPTSGTTWVFGEVVGGE